MHAFLIISHNNFKQLARLIELLDSIEHDIYIHIDKKSRNVDLNLIRKSASKSKIYMIERKGVSWGDYSTIDCEIRLMKAALCGNNYQYLHLLSGADMLIKSHNYLHDFFDRNNGKQFLHFESKILRKEEEEKIKYWFLLQYFVGKSRRESLLYCIQRGLVAIQKYLHIERHRNLNILFYKGANWASITSEFAKYVVEQEKWIYKIFCYSNCGDEFFLQTLLMNSKFKYQLYLNSFNNDYLGCMRCIDWNRGGPYVFRISDYNDLISSDYIFARKFDETVDNKIIQKIVEYVKNENEKEKA